MLRPIAILLSCSAVSTVRVSVWETSMVGTEAPTTVTAPSVVVPSLGVPEALLNDTSVPLAMLTVTFSRTATGWPSFCRVTL